MSIIEQLKAEIERLKEKYTNMMPSIQKCSVCDELLSFLDTLQEKSEKPTNPTIEKLRALIKMQIRREELNFASLGGGGQTMNIGALEWVLKQLDTIQEQPAKGPFTGEQIYNFLKEQPVNLDDAINNWQGKEAFPEGCGITPLPKAMEIVDKTARHFFALGQQSKPNPERKLRKVSTWVSDTEFGEEVEKVRQRYPEVGFAKVSRIAHHFVEWQKKQVTPVCEGLEEAAKQYVEKMKFSSIQSFEGAFKAGAEWQKDKDTRDMYMSDNRHFQKIYELGRKEEKEQMMKEAVEGNIYGVDEQWVESEVVEHIGQEGDKVKLIIIKED